MKKENFIKRKKRVRSKVSGTGVRPRLSVFRSNKFIYAQLIDDVKGHSLASASADKTDPTVVGAKIAKLAIAKKIKKAVFDKGGYRYHGKVKALADAARKGGLEF